MRFLREKSVIHLIAPIVTFRENCWYVQYITAVHDMYLNKENLGVNLLESNDAILVEVSVSTL